MRILLIPMICLCLGACLPSPEPQSTSQAPEKEANTEMRDTIQAPIKKAEKVEDQVLDGADKEKAAIEAASGD